MSIICLYNVYSGQDMTRVSQAQRTASHLFLPPVPHVLGKAKVKAIPVTGRGGAWSCEKSRLPHFLDNRLTDGGEVVSLRRRPPFAPQEDSWYSFLLEAESTPGT
jgi:hypothetical protein